MVNSFLPKELSVQNETMDLYVPSRYSSPVQQQVLGIQPKFTYIYYRILLLQK